MGACLSEAALLLPLLLILLHQSHTEEIHHWNKRGIRTRQLPVIRRSVDPGDKEAEHSILVREVAQLYPKLARSLQEPLRDPRQLLGAGDIPSDCHGEPCIKGVCRTWGCDCKVWCENDISPLCTTSCPICDTNKKYYSTYCEFQCARCESGINSQIAAFNTCDVACKSYGCDQWGVACTLKPPYMCDCDSLCNNCKVEFRPVCAWDDVSQTYKTFGSLCLLDCENCKNRQHSYTFVKYGECPVCGEYCHIYGGHCQKTPVEYICKCDSVCSAASNTRCNTPVCGSDKKTYNCREAVECERCFEQKNITVLHDKECGHECLEANVDETCDNKTSRWFYMPEMTECQEVAICDAGSGSNMNNAYGSRDACMQLCNPCGLRIDEPCPNYGMCLNGECTCNMLCNSDACKTTEGCAHPVCGTDGKTYKCECLLKCDSCKRNVTNKVHSRSVCNNTCTLHLEQGKEHECTNITYRWYHDWHHGGACKPFKYYGCGGNENMFLTWSECAARCQELECKVSQLMKAGNGVQVSYSGHSSSTDINSILDGNEGFFIKSPQEDSILINLTTKKRWLATVYEVYLIAAVYDNITDKEITIRFSKGNGYYYNETLKMNRAKLKNPMEASSLLITFGSNVPSKKYTLKVMGCLPPNPICTEEAPMESIIPDSYITEGKSKTEVPQIRPGQGGWCFTETNDVDIQLTGSIVRTAKVIEIWINPEIGKQHLRKFPNMFDSYKPMVKDASSSTNIYVPRPKGGEFLALFSEDGSNFYASEWLTKSGGALTGPYVARSVRISFRGDEETRNVSGCVTLDIIACMPTDSPCPGMEEEPLGDVHKIPDKNILDNKGTEVPEIRPNGLGWLVDTVKSSYVTIKLTNRLKQKAILTGVKFYKEINTINVQFSNDSTSYSTPQTLEKSDFTLSKNEPARYVKIIPESGESSSGNTMTADLVGCFPRPAPCPEQSVLNNVSLIPGDYIKENNSVITTARPNEDGWCTVAGTLTITLSKRLMKKATVTEIYYSGTDDAVKVEFCDKYAKNVTLTSGGGELDPFVTTNCINVTPLGDGYTEKCITFDVVACVPKVMPCIETHIWDRRAIDNTDNIIKDLKNIPIGTEFIVITLSERYFKVPAITEVNVGAPVTKLVVTFSNTSTFFNSSHTALDIWPGKGELTNPNYAKYMKVTPEYSASQSTGSWELDVIACLKDDLLCTEVDALTINFTERGVTYPLVYDQYITDEQGNARPEVRFSSSGSGWKVNSSSHLVVRLHDHNTTTGEASVTGIKITGSVTKFKVEFSDDGETFKNPQFSEGQVIDLPKPVVTTYIKISPVGVVDDVYNNNFMKMEVIGCFEYPCSKVEPCRPDQDICNKPYEKCFNVTYETGLGVPYCECPDCEGVNISYVCGTDEKNYESECKLQQVACENNVPNEVLNRGKCEVCYTGDCKPGQECINGTCACNDCDYCNSTEEVCVTDGKENFTVFSPCEADCQQCHQQDIEFDILYPGPCTLCHNVNCPLPSKCVKGICECTDVCACENCNFSVCAVDGGEVGCPCLSECFSCRNATGKELELLPTCDPCYNVTCGCDLEECKNGSCICEVCDRCNDDDNQPVCGSDDKTYQSMCHLECTRCEQCNKNLTVQYPGACDDCRNVSCAYGVAHDSKHKKCCPCDQSCDCSNSPPVCGVNGISYECQCAVDKATCQANFQILIAYGQKCEKCDEKTISNCFTQSGERCVNGSCTCDHICELDACGEDLCNSPVVGSDGKKYNCLCHMECEKCKQVDVTSACYNGTVESSKCRDILCLFGGECVDGKCLCDPLCDRCNETNCDDKVCTTNGEFNCPCKVACASCHNAEYISIIHPGSCNNCWNISCYFNSKCDELTGNCSCENVCSKTEGNGSLSHSAPVCGNDGKTYADIRALLCQECQSKKAIGVKHPGICSSCWNQTCESYETCESGACTCRDACDCPAYSINNVCGSDNQTYTSTCHLKCKACQDRTPDLCVKYESPCYECYGVECPNGKDCISGECKCQRACNCSNNCDKPVCGVENGIETDYNCSCTVNCINCQDPERSITMYDDKCDKCRHEVCYNGSTCINGECSCDESCSCSDCASGEAPVCGTDSMTYRCPCSLECHRCHTGHDVTVAYVGECYSCHGVECGFGSRCVNGSCSCDHLCDCGYEVNKVCGSDNKVYSSVCNLTCSNCIRKTSTYVKYTGDCNICSGTECKHLQTCDATTGQCSCAEICNYTCKPGAKICTVIGTEYDCLDQLKCSYCHAYGALDITIKHKGPCNRCYDTKCEFGATCDTSSGKCTCDDIAQRCKSCNEPVCSTNGKEYGCHCQAELEACQNQTEITVEYAGPCDRCRNVTCHFNRSCDSETGQCTCDKLREQCQALGDKCKDNVCGSDGNDYPCVCQMQLAACEQSTIITALYPGPCRNCWNKTCYYGARCAPDGNCSCDDVCAYNKTHDCNDPVCDAHGDPHECLAEVECKVCRLQDVDILNYTDECDLCRYVTCNLGATCNPENGKCECNELCDACGKEKCEAPICANINGTPTSFPCQCDLECKICNDQQPYPGLKSSSCNMCDFKKCAYGAECTATGDCKCDSKCSYNTSACTVARICGKDDSNYNCIEELECRECQRQTNIGVKHVGPCDVCHNKACYYGKECVDEGCTCDKICSHAMINTTFTVCASNSYSYQNPWDFECKMCQAEDNTTKIVHTGKCEPCYNVICKWGGNCVNGTCSCAEKCERCSGVNYQPLCGSDGKTYNSSCHLDCQVCQQQAAITVQYSGACDECRTEICSHGATCVDGACSCEPLCSKCSSYSCDSAVCGDDGNNYDCACKLDCQNCENKAMVNIEYQGNCNKCRRANYLYGAKCDVSTGNRTCSHLCDVGCNTTSSKVCGSNNKVYDCIEKLRCDVCNKKENITVVQVGSCPSCWNNTCAFGGKCINGNCNCDDICGKCDVSLYNNASTTCAFGNIPEGSVCSWMCKSCLSQQPGLLLESRDECDKCKNVSCPTKQNCIYGECHCDAMYDSCTVETSNDTVCDDQGDSHLCLCEMEYTECMTGVDICAVHRNSCDPCWGIHCPLGKVCQGGACGCGERCQCDDEVYQPVCAYNDILYRDYNNPCLVDCDKCLLNIEVNMSVGKCDKCKNKVCPRNQNCVDGVCGCQDAEMHCNALKAASSKPVCLQQNETLPHQCEVDVHWCQTAEELKIKYDGPCDPCEYEDCSELGAGAVCIDGTCTCDPVCSNCTTLDPVCGDDGKNHTNPCHLACHNCQNSTDVKIQHSGYCDKCRDIVCSFYGQCDPETGYCSCSHLCNNLDSFSCNTPVCGSDGRSYDCVEQLKCESCKSKQFIEIAYMGPCSDCLSKSCQFGQTCINGTCDCTEACRCEPCDSPVCVSVDSVEKTYDCQCKADCENCKAMALVVSVLYPGNCTSCYNKICAFGSKCVNGDCSCADVCNCENVLQSPVCGDDWNDYSSTCDLECMSCKENKSLCVAYGEKCNMCWNKTCTHGSTCDMVTGQCTCTEVCENINDEKCIYPVCVQSGTSEITKACMDQVECDNCLSRTYAEILHTESCQPCWNVTCKLPKVCRDGKCVCTEKCDYADDSCISQVCGSDGRTYDCLMHLECEQCVNNSALCVDYEGPCNLCRDVSCENGKTCINGVCTCQDICGKCSAENDVICANIDGSWTEVDSQCKLDCTNCKENTNYEAYPGHCDRCKKKKCHNLATCNATVGNCDCTCACKCDTCDFPLCAANIAGRTFDCPCALDCYLCHKHSEVEALHFDECDACFNKTCKPFETCIAGECKCDVCDNCPKPDNNSVNQVCGSDKVTYSYPCELECERCTKQRLDLTFMHSGECDKCLNTTCPRLQSCNKEDGKCFCDPLCKSDQCTTECNEPVCGGDGKDYPCGCKVECTECQTQTLIGIRHKGACNDCWDVDCAFGANCYGGNCSCDHICPALDYENCDDYVCGSDGVTYMCQQHLDCTKCRKQKPLTRCYKGGCRCYVIDKTCRVNETCVYTECKHVSDAEKYQTACGDDCSEEECLNGKCSVGISEDECMRVKNGTNLYKFFPDISNTEKCRLGFMTPMWVYGHLFYMIGYGKAHVNTRICLVTKDAVTIVENLHTDGLVIYQCWDTAVLFNDKIKSVDFIKVMVIGEDPVLKDTEYNLNDKLIYLVKTSYADYHLYKQVDHSFKGIQMAADRENLNVTDITLSTGKPLNTILNVVGPIKDVTSKRNMYIQGPNSENGIVQTEVKSRVDISSTPITVGRQDPGTSESIIKECKLFVQGSSVNEKICDPSIIARMTNDIVLGGVSDRKIVTFLSNYTKIVTRFAQ